MFGKIGETFPNLITLLVRHQTIIPFHIAATKQVENYFLNHDVFCTHLLFSKSHSLQSKLDEKV